MRAIYDTNAPEKAKSLSLNSDLLKKPRKWTFVCLRLLSKHWHNRSGQSSAPIGWQKIAMPYRLTTSMLKHTACSVPYLLDVQAELLGDLQTCVVVPLISADKNKDKAISRLTPILTI